MSEDKIFNAEKGNYSEVLQSTSFKVNPANSTQYSNDYFDDIESIDKRKIAELIETVMEPYAKKMKQRSYNFKKNEIVDIYTEIRKITNRYGRIPVLIILCDYLSISPSRLYNFLGNGHKNEIVEEFDDSTNLVSKRGIKRLF